MNYVSLIFYTVTSHCLARDPCHSVLFIHLSFSISNPQKKKRNLVMTMVKGSKVIVSVKSYGYPFSSVGNFMGKLEGERPVMQSEVLIDRPDSYQK